MQVLKITSQDEGQRLDKFLCKFMAEAPKSFFYKMLRKKNIVLNGKKAEGSVHLSPGDCVTLYFSDETFEKFSSNVDLKLNNNLNKKQHSDKSNSTAYDSRRRAAEPLQVLFENQDVLIINKPAGMLSQKSVPSDFSANEQVIQYLLDTGAVTQQMLRTFRPSVCNRLDRNTSGILIAGKTLRGLQTMSRQLRDRSIAKYYRCIVVGNLEKEQHLKAFLTKDLEKNKVEIYKDGDVVPGSLKKDLDAGMDVQNPALNKKWMIETEYKPIRQYKGFTLLEVHLITGRSHQIRAHLAAAGHPIIGDAKYGSRKANEQFSKTAGLTHQLLHAYRICLADGTEVTAPLPEMFQKIEQQLKIMNNRMKDE